MAQIKTKWDEKLQTNLLPFPLLFALKIAVKRQFPQWSHEHMIRNDESDLREQDNFDAENKFGEEEYIHVIPCHLQKFKISWISSSSPTSICLENTL